MIGLGTEAVDDQVKAVDFLRRAIERHRELNEQAMIDPTPIDNALWQSLEGKWEFDTIDPNTIDI
jgi:hypothetical protein